MSDTTHARVPVAVLGATGAVGQTFVRLLDGHPLFEIVEVAASSRSQGRTYMDAASWHVGELPGAGLATCADARVKISGPFAAAWGAAGDR